MPRGIDTRETDLTLSSMPKKIADLLAPPTPKAPSPPPPTLDEKIVAALTAAKEAGDALSFQEVHEKVNFRAQLVSAMGVAGVLLDLDSKLDKSPCQTALDRLCEAGTVGRKKDKDKEYFYLP